MKNQHIFLRSIALILICLSGCSIKKSKTTQSDFSFYIPEVDIYVTTSKRVNAEFFVMFSLKSGIAILSDTISYIECETMDSDVVIIFDPKEKKNIYITYPNIKKINKTDFNLCRMTEMQHDAMFYEKRIRTNPLILKAPYLELIILPASYTIILQRDSSFKSQTRIKEGDINEGW